MSQTEPEQDHIVSALVFELSKVELPIIRATMLGHLANIDDSLGERVAAGLGHDGEIPDVAQAVPTRTDLETSPKLSIIARGPPTLEGRDIGVLVTDGGDSALIGALIEAGMSAGASVKFICPRVGGVTLDDGSKLKADHQLAGGPSVLFDTVAVVASETGVTGLLGEAAAVAWVHDAFHHLKVIAHSAAAQPLLDAAGVDPDEGVIALGKAGDAGAFIDRAGAGRIWPREAKVKTLY
jgi:catalase